MKTLFRNGRIFTGAEECQFADSMLVEDGIVRMVGTEEAVTGSAAAEEAVTVVDLGGKRVIPGLIDAHMHGMLLAEFSKQISCLPPEVNSIGELIARIRKESEHTAPGGWIKGWGYDEGKLEEGRAPDRYDLDRGTTEYPVYIARTCVHIASVNSKALELAGIDRNTPDPPGGHIVRDENGEPTGILQENARNMVIDRMPVQSVEEIVQDIVDLGELLLSQGIVAFTDLGNFGDIDPLKYYDAAAKKGLRQDVAVYYMWENARVNNCYTINEDTMDQARQIRAAGLKLIADGSVSGQTAYVDVPFLGTENYGIDELSDELLESAIAFCREHRCQLSVHAMGGNAIEKVLSRVTEEENWMESSAPYLRMEHVTEPQEGSVDKAVRHGVMFAMQPIFQYCEIESYLANLGPERTRQASPIRHLLDKGADLAISTDAPATSWAVPSDPWTNMKAAVTRVAYDGTDCGKLQAIDQETVVRLYTDPAARICGFRGLGKLAPGYRASFAVLEKDLFDVPGSEIDRIRVQATYIDGEKVYAR